MCELENICYDVKVTAGVSVDENGNPDHDEIYNNLAENARHDWAAEDLPYYCYECCRSFADWDSAKEHLVVGVAA